MKRSLVILLLTGTLVAAEIPDAPQPQHTRLWSRQNIVAFSLNAGLRVADSAVTCQNLSHGGHEFSLPMQSCGGVTAWNLSMVPAQIGAVYLLQRTGHHKLARITAWGFPAADVPSLAYSAHR